MKKTIFVCDSCHKESEGMMDVGIHLTENKKSRAANFNVCSEECIPTAVKMALMIAKEQPNDLGKYQQHLQQYLQPLTGASTSIVTVDTGSNSSVWSAISDKFKGIR